MRYVRGYALLVLLLVLAMPVRAATLTGLVYDLSLEQVPTAIVSTSEGQRMVTRTDGSYTFTLPAGEYTITANATVDGMRLYASEDITLQDEGEYVLDLILAPVLEGDDGLSIRDPAPAVVQQAGASYLSYGIAVLVLAAGVAGILITRRLRHSAQIADDARSDEYRAEVLAVLKSSHGRATQKEIRKAVRFSEAKVSLVLSELEDDGLVRKIKRGRGNIIVLR